MRLHLLPILTLSYILPAMAYGGEQTVLKYDTFNPPTHSKPSLADLLTIEPSASIFYTYARELELSSLFSDEQARSTLLVPTNKVVMALARKPHQGSTRVEEGIQISEEEYDKISKENVERWVSGHIIPKSPIDLNSPEPHQTLLDGKSISFKPITKSSSQGPDWTRVTLEDGVKILQMREASNGVLYIIDGAIISA
ncbi:hypothetical protein AX17_000451 [Amanita inopinata Kibby_2008]|nr:hypothetical protein AX17_000451 [Amanita inopinata Kibby_2008]